MGEARYTNDLDRLDTVPAQQWPKPLPEPLPPRLCTFCGEPVPCADHGEPAEDRGQWLQIRPKG